MYVDSNHLDYCYLVELSDNYVVLTNRRNVSASFDNPTEYPIVYQYISPSIYCVESTRITRSNITFTQIDVDDDFYLRGDCLNIVIAQFYVLFFVVFLINAMTRLFKKGGIFFGS